MPNLASIYSNAISNREDTGEASYGIISPVLKELKFQEKVDWINNPATVEIFKALKEECNAIEEQARKLACSYPQHKDETSIIHLLVRSSEIRKIVEKYGKVSS